MRVLDAAPANERYTESLAAIPLSTPLGRHLQRLAQRTELKGQPVRGLRAWDAEDSALLQAVNRGEFLIQGLRNRELRALLYPSTRSPNELKRQSARISRQLRRLRAHGSKNGKIMFFSVLFLCSLWLLLFLLRSRQSRTVDLPLK